MKSKKTLMGYSKSDLAEHYMCLEHNYNALNEKLERQYRILHIFAKGIKLMQDIYQNKK